MPALKLHVEVEKLPLSAPFRISGFVFEEQQVVVVTLDDGEHRGRGEASGKTMSANRQTWFGQPRGLTILYAVVAVSRLRVPLTHRRPRRC